eukprot:scaffold1340_cov253-Pinguiococcus_pyrenoidosus.AAC.47
MAATQLRQLQLTRAHVGQAPDADVAVGAAGGQLGPAEGHAGERVAQVAFAAGEDPPRRLVGAAGAERPQTQRGVPGRRGQQLAIWREGHGAYGVGVPGDRRRGYAFGAGGLSQPVARLQHPHAQDAIGVAGAEEALIRRELHIFDRCAAAASQNLQRGFGAAAVPRATPPQMNAAVSRSRRQERSGRRKSHRPHAGLVAQQAHRRLWVGSATAEALRAVQLHRAASGARRHGGVAGCAGHAVEGRVGWRPQNPLRLRRAALGAAGASHPWARWAGAKPLSLQSLRRRHARCAAVRGIRSRRGGHRGVAGQILIFVLLFLRVEALASRRPPLVTERRSALGACGAGLALADPRAGGEAALGSRARGRGAIRRTLRWIPLLPLPRENLATPQNSETERSSRAACAVFASPVPTAQRAPRERSDQHFANTSRGRPGPPAAAAAGKEQLSEGFYWPS